MLKVYKPLCYAIVSTLIIASCQSDTASSYSEASKINPDIWPIQPPVMVRDEAMEQRITELLAKMTVRPSGAQSRSTVRDLFSVSFVTLPSSNTI